MAWVKLDDQYRTNLKVLAVGPAGVALDVAGICFCSANLTDGFIPDAAVASLYPVRNLKPTVKALVDNGRWTRDDDRGGYWIHDYLTYNPTRDKVVAEREKQRKKKEAQRRDADGTYRRESPGDTPRDNRGESLPSRPLPVLPDVVSSSSSDQSVGPPASEEEDWAMAEARQRLARRPAHLGPVNDVTKWLARTATKVRADGPPPAPKLSVVRRPCGNPDCSSGWLPDPDDPDAVVECECRRAS